MNKSLVFSLTDFDGILRYGELSNINLLAAMLIHCIIFYVTLSEISQWTKFYSNADKIARLSHRSSISYGLGVV